MVPVENGPGVGMPLTQMDSGSSKYCSSNTTLQMHSEAKAKIMAVAKADTAMPIMMVLAEGVLREFFPIKQIFFFFKVL